MPFTMQDQIDMFGETVADFEMAKPNDIDPLMYAMMILSDAQEVIERGNRNVARQYINKAKHFIDQARREKRGS